MVRRHFEKCYGHWESPQSWAASTNQIARNDIVTSKFILMYVLHSRRPFCSLRIPLLLALVTITQLFIFKVDVKPTRIGSAHNKRGP